MNEEWINLDTGVLHRPDCHTAVHIIRNQSKMKYNVERFDGRALIASVPQDHSQRFAPIGTGVGYLSKCKTCKPVGDDRLSEARPWAYLPGDTWKSAGDLSSSDVGRESEYGFIECIEHGKERTVIALSDGTLQYLHPDERIGLYVREPEREYGDGGNVSAPMSE